jgi:uncharacterized protein with PIN domain
MSEKPSLAGAIGYDEPMTPMTFAVDRMLGRLARWLRILGYDAAYGPELYGAALVALARREGRLIVTRDTRLARRRDRPAMVFIERDGFRDQLREIARAVPLAPVGFCTRCVECNRLLEPAGREAVRAPAYVLATQTRFWRCPSCHRTYWPATHIARMRDELAALGIACEVPG